MNNIKKGYTLIELLIVMAIMWLILTVASAVLTSFISYQKASNNAYILYQSVKDVQTNVSNNKYHAWKVKFQIWQPSLPPAEISYYLTKEDMQNPAPPFTTSQKFNDEWISIWKIRIKNLSTYSTRNVSSVYVVYEWNNIRLYDDVWTELESIELNVYNNSIKTGFIVKMDKYHILPKIEKWN